MNNKKRGGLLIVSCYSFLLLGLLLINRSSFFAQESLNKLEVESSFDLELEQEKLQNFKNKLENEGINAVTFSNAFRSYSKDSLQILSVKLMSVKILESKKLLSKDIALNSHFYLQLLEELQESDINPKEYLFLKEQLTFYELKRTEKEYAISKWINGMLLLLVFGLLYVVYGLKKTKPIIVNELLSKQESNIKNYMLQGKTNKEIAEELFISLSTVKTHITNIYQKLNISNRKELHQINNK